MISLQKVDSLLVLVNVREAKKVYATQGRGFERKTFRIETHCESMAINENWGE